EGVDRRGGADVVEVDVEANGVDGRVELHHEVVRVVVVADPDRGGIEATRVSDEDVRAGGGAGGDVEAREDVAGAEELVVGGAVDGAIEGGARQRAGGLFEVLGREAGVVPLEGGAAGVDGDAAARVVDDVVRSCHVGAILAGGRLRALGEGEGRQTHHEGGDGEGA